MIRNSPAPTTHIRDLAPSYSRYHGTPDTVLDCLIAAGLGDVDRLDPYARNAITQDEYDRALAGEVVRGVRRQHLARSPNCIACGGIKEPERSGVSYCRACARKRMQDSRQRAKSKAWRFGRPHP